MLECGATFMSFLLLLSNHAIYIYVMSCGVTKIELSIYMVNVHNPIHGILKRFANQFHFQLHRCNENCKYRLIFRIMSY